MSTAAPRSRLRSPVGRLRAPTIALIAACVFAGCAQSAPPGKAPASSSGKGGSGKASAQPATVREFASVDANKVTGSSSVTFSNPAAQITATVPRVKGARNLSQAGEVLRERYLRQAHLDGASKVDVTSHFIGSSSVVVGLAVVGTTSVKGKDVVTPATVWYDSTRGQSFSGSVLIAWDQWGPFQTLVDKAAKDASLDQDKVNQALSDNAAPYGTGPAIGFAGNGDVVVAFGSGVVKDEPVSVVVPEKDATPLLSSIGKLGRGSATSPESFGAGSATNPYKPSKNMPPASKSPNENPLQGSISGSASASPSAETVKHPSTAIGVDCIVKKCIAITYDDGPGPQTPELIKTLDAAKASATFFQMGNSIKEYPQTTVAVASAGFEVGNHTVAHNSLTSSNTNVPHEVSGNSEILKKYLGRTPLLFRPPYGAHNKKADKVIADNGMAIIQWSIDTNDWDPKVTHKDPAAVIKNATQFSPNYTQPIVLMHDIHSWTITAAPTVISNLQNKGYTLVTVSELTLNTGGVKTGHSYCHGTAATEDSAPSWCSG